jgi:hypothetical protein
MTLRTRHRVVHNRTESFAEAIKPIRERFEACREDHPVRGSQDRDSLPAPDRALSPRSWLKAAH